MRCILTVNFSPWSPYSGGGQRSTHNLATALANRGHDVTVVYTKPAWEEVAVPSFLRYEPVWADLPAFRSASNAVLRPWTTVSVARQVSRLLERQRGACIVHGNGEECALVSKLRPRHSFGFVVTPRYPSYPISMSDGSWRDRLSLRLWLSVAQTRYVLLGRTLKYADLWCPTSQYAADQAALVYRADLAKMRIVYNGVSAEFLSQYPRAATEVVPESSPDVRAVFFGRMTEEKGIFTIVEALALVGRALSEFVFVGRGPDAERLRARVRELRLDSWVRIVPWLDTAELAALVNHAYMAVLPSFEESFGNSIAEAMVLGIPVVSAKAGSVPELIEHGRTGLLVSPGDTQALADAMILLASNKAHARQLGEAARKYARERFTWDIAAEAFERHYETILEHRTV